MNADTPITVGNPFVATWRYKLLMLRRMWRHRHQPLRVQVKIDGEWLYLADTDTGKESP